MAGRSNIVPAEGENLTMNKEKAMVREIQFDEARRKVFFGTDSLRFKVEVRRNAMEPGGQGHEDEAKGRVFFGTDSRRSRREVMREAAASQGQENRGEAPVVMKEPEEKGPVRNAEVPREPPRTLAGGVDLVEQEWWGRGEPILTPGRFGGPMQYGGGLCSPGR